MKKRLLLPHITELLKKFPAVALLGPRQSGKTTLAQLIDGSYYDLEQEEERLRLDLEWPKVTAQKRLLILDEAQVYPEIFPRLRAAIDSERKKNGRFLLLGSVAPVLMRNISESLAGRLAICELTPFILPELSEKELDTLWFFGGFPDGGILESSLFPRWQKSYLELLAQRDLPNWGLPAKPQTTLRFLKMLAVFHGQIWNASKVGLSMGLNYHTVNSYLDYLEGVYLVRRLLPFHGNLKKRLIKSPKIFWRDSGLLHSLLSVQKPANLFVQPWVGMSWQGFVTEQIIAYLQTLGKSFEAHYLRVSDESEIDLILDLSGGRWAFEIKLTTSPSPADLKHLNKTADLIGADKRILVSRVTKTAESERVISTNLTGVLERLKVE